MKPRGHEILEHPADVGISAHGESLQEAFEEAAGGLMEIILDPATVRPRTAMPVSITASDHQQLLVRWLSEVLFLYDGKRFPCAEFSIHELGPTWLVATVRGEELDTTRHLTRLDVKAITYHQLEIREGAGHARVRVFLDI
jgi:SHS2 domain-containing protein